MPNERLVQLKIVAGKKKTYMNHNLPGGSGSGSGLYSGGLTLEHSTEV